MEADNTGLVLITFPPSLDSELARFLAQHYGLGVREQRHTLIFSSFATLWHGFTVIFPLLYGKGVRLAGPRAIADHYDLKCAPELRLLPDLPADRQQVDADWQLFNKDLAVATAVFAYYHLLPHRELMVTPLSSGTPAIERASVRAVYPVFAGLLKLLLQLNAQHVAKSIELVRATFSAVESRIADGRSYLFGDQPMLADFAFAVAAAPVVLPPNYGGPIPPFEQMPSEIQAVVREMRVRPAGAFASRIYQLQRTPSAPAM